jgi:hypothetical protein
MNVTTKRLGLASVLAFSLVFAAAAEEDDTPDPVFTDGRLNPFDAGAPVVPYAYYAYPFEDDQDMGVLDYIEVWGLNTSDYFELVMIVTADEIAAADTSGGTSALVDTGLGYAVYLEVDGSLTFAAPADAEGKVYTFNWEPS